MAEDTQEVQPVASTDAREVPQGNDDMGAKTPDLTAFKAELEQAKHKVAGTGDAEEISALAARTEELVGKGKQIAAADEVKAAIADHNQASPVEE